MACWFIRVFIYGRAGRISPAAPVLAGPVFLKVKKFHFCERQVINKSASVILGLIRLVILSYNR